MDQCFRARIVKVVSWRRMSNFVLFTKFFKLLWITWGLGVLKVPAMFA